MANSAGDARGSELEIRKKLIQSGAVDVIVSIGSNFFYTVTLPCTLWFFDTGKTNGPRKDNVRSTAGRGGHSDCQSPHRVRTSVSHFESRFADRLHCDRFFPADRLRAVTIHL